MECDAVNSYFNDGSLKERSTCLALIRQTFSTEKPDLTRLLEFKLCYPKSCCGGFDYAAFIEDEWNGVIAKHIPDWPCIKLKPEILEEAIRNCLSQHNLQYFKECVKENINRWFVFNYTEKPDFWYKVVDTLSTIHSEIVKDTNIEQPIKEQKDEIKFQRKKGCILRGTVPEGNQQSSRKRQTATCSGHLGYQVCTGR